MIIVRVGVEACIYGSLRFADNFIHFGHHTLLENIVEHFGVFNLYGRCGLKLFALFSSSWLALDIFIPHCYAAFFRFILLSLLQNLIPLVHTALEATFAKKVRFLRDRVRRYLHVVLLLVDVAVSAVVVFVLEVLEALFCV